MPESPEKPPAPALGRPTSHAPWLIVAAGAMIGVAAVAAYHNSLAGPFIFDDLPAIVDNPTIRHLWPLRGVLSTLPDGGPTASGRPLVNLSLAVNYALGGNAVRGYHVANLLIHVLAGLMLFGVVRRTLLRPGGRSLPAGDAAWSPASRLLQNHALIVAFFIALLWTLHPLQTESVTYIVQRAEALMGLCYLLTLYGFIRGAEAAETGGGHERGPAAGVGWLALSFVACLLGMASKEVMVSAPLMVLLHDRTFVSGTFREAWRRRKLFYGALASTWILLVYLMLGTGSRGGTVGFAAGISAWHYALTQCRAVVHYLRLALWPHPLVFDYGEATAKSPAEVWPQALVLIALVGGTVVALWRRPVWGFLGVWFFAILAPSSSVVPLPHQTLAEHRMYLSLAAVVALVVAGLFARWGRSAGWACAVLAVVCGLLTVQRNEDYQSAYQLWTDTIAKQPGNERAQASLGDAFARDRRWPEAMAQYEKALQLRPDYVDAQTNLGKALMEAGRASEGIARLEEALRLRPGYFMSEHNLAYALEQAGRSAEAIIHFERTMKLMADRHGAELYWALILMRVNRVDEAMIHFEQAAKLKPNSAETELNWALALAVANRLPEALPHFEKAVALNPDSAAARVSYGRVLAQQGRFDQAVTQYEGALRLNPKDAEAHLNLSIELRQLGRIDQAAEHYREAIRLNPELAARK